MNPPNQDPALLAEHLRLVTTDEAGLPTEGGARVYAVLGPVPLPVTLANGTSATFQWTTFTRLGGRSLAAIQANPRLIDTADGRLELLRHLSQADEWPQSILSFGDFNEAALPLVRVHSNCATGDIFGSQRCECGPQLRSAMAQVHDSGSGAVIYMANHEGRGIGLFAKAAAYLLQDQGLDTYEANRRLGYDEDDRDFSDGAFILNHLRGAGRPIRLLSNNPEKRRALTETGIPVREMVPLITGVTSSNVRYLATKREYGHLLPEDLLELDHTLVTCEAS